MPVGDTQQHREALKLVATTLKAAGVRFALAGGYAAWAHGAPEPEHDVDFAVVPDDVAAAEQALAAAGVRVEHPAEDWLVKAWPGDALVDLVHRVADRDVGAEVTRRAEVVDVLSVHMPVLSPTDVLAHKLRSMSEHSCDPGKALPAARALRERVDWAALAADVADNPYARAFLFLARELGIVDDATVTSPR